MGDKQKGDTHEKHQGKNTDAYHALGGNGMITHLKEDIENLPIKNWESEEKKDDDN